MRPFLCPTVARYKHAMNDQLGSPTLCCPLVLSRPPAPPACLLGFSHRQARVVELLIQHGTPAIVYASRVSEVEALLSRLRSAFAGTPHVIETYHGPGMSGTYTQSESERSRVLTAFLEGHANVVVATSAFGLGINKREIRQIVHVRLHCWPHIDVAQAARPHAPVLLRAVAMRDHDSAIMLPPLLSPLMRPVCVLSPNGGAGWHSARLARRLRAGNWPWWAWRRSLRMHTDSGVRLRDCPRPLAR